MYEDSIKLFSRAKQSIPGGVNSPVRAFQSVSSTPLFFDRGEGPYLIDVSGQRYIDYVGSWGPLILGHAPQSVLNALQTTMQKGLSFGAPTILEIELAERIKQWMPSLEMIRMVNSGTEATLSAIRLARGFTKRNKILKFQGCYHGHSDSLLIKAGSGLLTLNIASSLGIPEDFVKHTLIANFNDLVGTTTLFEAYGQDIAAVIVEPIAGNMNCIPASPEFLQGLRSLTSQYNTLLIFDEVITGFRVAKNGAQSLYNITPDLTCLGKIIGGGLPVGAFGGKREIMEMLAPLGPVYQAGTLSGNPLCMAAGLQTLTELDKPGVYETLAEKTKYLLHGLQNAADRYHIPFKTQQVGSMFGLFFTPQAIPSSYQEVMNCNQEHFQLFFHYMLSLGVYFAPSLFESGFVSLAHDQAVLDQTIEYADEAFWKIHKQLS